MCDPATRRKKAAKRRKVLHIPTVIENVALIKWKRKKRWKKETTSRFVTLNQRSWWQSRDKSNHPHPNNPCQTTSARSCIRSKHARLISVPIVSLVILYVILRMSKSRISTTLYMGMYFLCNYLRRNLVVDKVAVSNVCNIYLNYMKY